MVADEWARLWLEGAEILQPPSGALPSDLPPLPATDLKMAAMTFPPHTGLGADNLAPRALASLPHQQLQTLAHLLNLCEKEGRWRRQWTMVLIVLLPKPDGGRRLIGLFPAAMRIWMRARAPALRKWDQHNSRPPAKGR